MKGEIETVSVDICVGLIMAESDRCIHSKKSTIISFSETRLARLRICFKAYL